MASDENHRPCLPLKPQEKVQISCYNIFIMEDINFIDKYFLLPTFEILPSCVVSLPCAADTLCSFSTLFHSPIYINHFIISCLKSISVIAGSRSQIIIYPLQHPFHNFNFLFAYALQRFIHRLIGQFKGYILQSPSCIR